MNLHTLTSKVLQTENISKGFQKATEKFQTELLELDRLRAIQEKLTDEFKKADSAKKEELKPKLVKIYKEIKAQEKKVESADALFHKMLQQEPVDLDENCCTDYPNKVVTEANDELKKIEDAIKIFQDKIAKQGRITNARDEEHLERLIKLYKQRGGKKIKESRNSVTEALTQGDYVKYYDVENGKAYPWYIIYIDSTHVELSNKEPKPGDRRSGFATYHIRQLNHKPWYDDMVKWMKTGNKKHIEGKKYPVNESAESVTEGVVTIQTKDGKLHHYPNFKKDKVISFLTKNKMKQVSNKNDLKTNMDFYVVESVNENVSPSKVRSAINQTKKQLAKRWKQKGAYEDFGQKELRKLKDKFNYNPYGTSDEREIADMLDSFGNWAMNYVGESVNEAKGDQWYIMTVDEFGDDKIVKRYDTFDKDKIQKDFDSFVKKTSDEEEVHFMRDTKRHVGEYILSVVNDDGKYKREITKGNRTFYKPYNMKGITESVTGSQKINFKNEKKEKIKIETPEDHQFWSDVYKDETGFRPRMSAKELQKWANDNFIVKDNEYVLDESRGKIGINDEDAYSFWSDKYKEEKGRRPKMSYKELEKWANDNFTIKGNKYVKISESTMEEATDSPHPDDLKKIGQAEAKKLFDKGKVVYIQTGPGKPKAHNTFMVSNLAIDGTMNIYLQGKTPKQFGFDRIVKWLEDREKIYNFWTFNDSKFWTLDESKLIEKKYAEGEWVAVDPKTAKILKRFKSGRAASIWMNKQTDDAHVMPYSKWKLTYGSYVKERKGEGCCPDSLIEVEAGDRLVHKHNPDISIELVEPTSKGWKVKQTGDGTSRGKKKAKTAYFDSQDIEGPKSLFVKESVNVGKYKTITESAEAAEIAQFTGTRADAVKRFIDTHNLDAKKLLKYVKDGNLADRMNFMTALVGKPNNKYQKMILSKFGLKESVNESKDAEVIDDLRGIVKSGQYSSVKDPQTGKKVKVDLFTASAILKVYDALNTANKKKMTKLAIPAMADVAFKMIK